MDTGSLLVRESGEDGCSRFFRRLDDVEVDLVVRAVAVTDRLRLRPFATLVTRLGNGWIYPLLSLVLLIAGIARPARFIGSAAASLAIAIMVYPALKRVLGRSRPCDYAPALVNPLRPLDQYSCPSGHAMTAAAYGVTILYAWPAAAFVGICLCAVVGWSRVALGHHYITDVVVGMILGAGIATLVATVIF